MSSADAVLYSSKWKQVNYFINTGEKFHSEKSNKVKKSRHRIAKINEIAQATYIKPHTNKETKKL